MTWQSRGMIHAKVAKFRAKYAKKNKKIMVFWCLNDFAQSPLTQLRLKVYDFKPPYPSPPRGEGGVRGDWRSAEQQFPINMHDDAFKFFSKKLPKNKE